MNGQSDDGTIWGWEDHGSRRLSSPNIQADPRASLEVRGRWFNDTNTEKELPPFQSGLVPWVVLIE